MQHSAARAVRLVAAFAVLAAALGCSTVQLCKIRTFSDPRLEYLVKGLCGDTGGQQTAAEQISAAEFARLSKSFKPAAGTRVLAPWRRYVEQLKAPIVIPNDVYAGSREIVRRPDIEALRKYIEAHPEKLSLVGAQYSAPWTAELADAAQQVAALQAEVDELLAGARKALAEKQYGPAMSLLSRALEITPEDPALRDRLDKLAETWAAYAAAEGLPALDQIRAQVEKLQQSFGQPASTTGVVAQCEKLLNDYEGKLNDSRTAIAIAQKMGLAKARLDALQPIQKAVADHDAVTDALRAKDWAEQVRLLSKEKLYWRAYEYLSGRIQATGEKPEARRGARLQSLKGIYLAMLPGGLEHLLGTANDSYDKDRFGLAMTLCFMAEELADYARAAGMGVPRAAEEWLGRIAETKTDTIKKLTVRLSRKLYVLDFLPAVTEEGMSFAHHVRNRCNRSYEAPNDMVWALSVPKDKELTEKSVERESRADYLVNGEIAEITVNTLVPQELDRQVHAVGSDLIRVVPDPLFAIKQSKTKTVFSQDVYLFQRTRVKSLKEGRIKLAMYYRHAERNNLPLLSAEGRFPSTNAVLPRITLEAEDVYFDSPFLGTPRTSAEQQNLVADPWPTAVRHNLSSDKDIMKAMAEWALDKTMVVMDKMVAQYPVEDLARPAAVRDAQNDLLGAAEGWGECLLYCHQLAMAGAASAGQDIPGWIGQRDYMLTSIGAWCTGRWKDQPAPALKNMRNLWGVAVSAANRQLAPPAQ